MKYFNYILLMLYLTTGYAVAEQQPLELVTLQYPPYEYEEKGEIKGIAVDLITEAFKRMDQPINITFYPFARALKMIELGHADALFTAYKTPEREVMADYSNEVLIQQATSLYTLRDSLIQYDGNLATLSDYTLGACRTLSYGTIFDDAVEKGIIIPELAHSGEQNMRLLLRKRIDLLVSNQHGALFILKKLGSSQLVKELHPEIQRVPSYIAFSKKNNLREVRDQFDQHLAAMKKDGTYHRIIANYQE